MTNHDDRNTRTSTPSGPGERGARKKGPLGIRARRLLWWSGVAVVAAVLLADPLNLHPVDGWIHHLLGHHEEHEAQADPAGRAQLWTCPMHPEVLQKEPGTCPICKMDLVPVKGMEDAPPARGVAGAGKPSGSDQVRTSGGEAQLWTCGMHPQVIQEEPGTCPICHMDLVPLRDDDVAEEGGEHAAHEKPVVRIDPVVIQNMNVTTELVARRDVRRQIRTVGYLDYDQEKIVSVTTKYNGFVEKTYVNYIGQAVRRGEPLFEVYSPELVQTQEEFLAAGRYVERMQDAPREARERARSLMEAARARLGYWDISAEQIRNLGSTGAVLRTLTVVAPAGGVVMKRMEGLEGMAVKPGMEVIQIADLSTLWLSVEIFEDQLPWIDLRTTAEIHLTYFPGEIFTGAVRYIEPKVSERTRSVRVTLEVTNPDRRLRAGMYATVEFRPIVVQNAVAVPSQAVIRTGERDIVVVALGGGRFVPREVVLGPEGEGFVTVSSGLDAGDRVVTSAQFLIDSESNLRAAIQKMVSGAGHQH